MTCTLGFRLGTMLDELVCRVMSSCAVSCLLYLLQAPLTPSPSLLDEALLRAVSRSVDVSLWWGAVCVCVCVSRLIVESCVCVSLSPWYTAASLCVRVCVCVCVEAGSMSSCLVSNLPHSSGPITAPVYSSTHLWRTLI